MSTLNTQPHSSPTPTPAERVAGFRARIKAAQAARDVEAERSVRREITGYVEHVLCKVLNPALAAFAALRPTMEEALLRETWRCEEPYMVPIEQAYDECITMLGTFSLAWQSGPGTFSTEEVPGGCGELARGLYDSLRSIDHDVPRAFTLRENGVEIARLQRGGTQEDWTLTVRRGGVRKSWAFNSALRNAIVDVVDKLGLE